MYYVLLAAVGIQIVMTGLLAFFLPKAVSYTFVRWTLPGISVSLFLLAIVILSKWVQRE